jgi:hypothetical protein
MLEATREGGLKVNTKKLEYMAVLLPKCRINHNILTGNKQQ